MTDGMQQDLVRMLDAIGDVASDPTGGITRLLYSKEWVESQKVLKQMMEDAGLETYYDAIGNLYGRLPGVGSAEETVLTGSHVDTVRNGGKYDGMYGIIAGIVALKHLKNTYGSPKRNIEVISFAEEEGSRFPTVFWGSKNFLGLEKRAEAEKLHDHEGRAFADEMRKAGFDFKKVDHSKRDDPVCFIEAHIEQGNVLEMENKDIGVVDSITGQRRFTVELTGTANHAGTTPMHYRQDALYAAAKMIAKILDDAHRIGSPLVATTGMIEAKPNIVNVVPGAVEFSLDVRHTDNAFLKEFTDGAVEDMKRIAGECGVEIKVDMWMDEPPVPMSGDVVRCLEEVCAEQKLDYRVMHSGAGHDSQLIAQHIPTAMLFVPSRDGISHNPGEYTAPEQLEKGTRALIGALHRLAYK